MLSDEQAQALHASVFGDGTTLSVADYVRKIHAAGRVAGLREAYDISVHTSASAILRRAEEVEAT